MKLFKIFAFLLSAIMLCFPGQVSAVRAYPYPVEVKQPNGETITIQAHGDEFFHYVTTTDGYVIALDDEGYFTFAEISGDGHLQPGKVRVSENTLKSGNNSFLKADSPEFIQKIKQPALSRRAGALKNVTALRSSSASRMRSAENTTAGDTKALVILAAFTDQAFSISNPQQSFTSMLNDPGYKPGGSTGFTGSVRDYFISSSDGAYSPSFEVYGPVQLPNNMEFYGANDADGNDVNPRQMIIDACVAAKNMYPDLNFADFPLNKDGSLDHVCVIYSGYNEAENSQTLPNTIWPHQWRLQYWEIPVSERTIDGVVIDSYMCTSELRGQSPNGTMAGIGTFCHEYGHTLGQPDLYDTNGSKDGSAITEPGSWCIMSSGNYLNNGNTPPAYGVTERGLLGWIDLWYVPEGNVAIPPITSSNKYKAFAIDTPTKGEFFTLEVRKKEGWDSFLPGEGMLIYHIDMSGYNVQTTDYDNVTMADLWSGRIPNIVGDHPGMQLITANGEIMTQNPSGSYSYKNYGGHPFPGVNNVTSISDNTTPGFLSWNNEKSGVSINNIARNTTTGSVSFLYSKVVNDVKENSISSPFAFSDGHIIYFKNIPGSAQVNIYDVKGTLYSSKNIFEPDNLEITVPGIYIVKLQTNNEVFTYKIIIK
ncbi:MAG: M6 family metalloprotease domain-containing protein [Candidatus Azobacteroides sp.]|nr:M6 family metalloprotease domain-containing protein [Candidatus Azobacteroides sp.]